ncbi:M20 peptidase aminoacylase family protein [Alteribacter keqinensis]|uniref:Amidohydrolase n=1 Tax=Alteribacter keqinensis TaxID=2483800 RepID=A0A3M7TWM4_9BACI|nr:M20 peptidase aminoacylase family protein [Alteribacter keqinensis]RNA69988.1 amidohydrolase [Alteribacter keqinensis]
MSVIGEEEQSVLKDVFNHLHENPEVSWDEVNTTAYIKDFFEKRGVKSTTFEDCTGLVAEIGEGRPVVAVRADMDALWQEVDGEFRANHSCGHDAHMTIVLGVFLRLMEKEKLNGTVRFLFQPAEEKGAGALKLVDKGVVDDADFLFGMHLRPVQELDNGSYAPAISHGATRHIRGVIEGDDAHGARPHLNTNAIQVGAELVQAINNMHFDPLVPHSMKVTAFQAGGESANIIPGRASFTVDVRAQNNELMEEMAARLERTIAFSAEYNHVSITTETIAEMAAAVLNDEATEVMAEAIKETTGEETLRPVRETTGGDDFHFYTIKKPELKATMLAVGCDLSPGLHHPRMTFDRNALPKAVDIITRAVEKVLEK